MKKLLLILSISFTANISCQTKTIEIKVENKPWTTGELFSNINTREKFDGDMIVGDNFVMPWVTNRAWVEFQIPPRLKGAKIVNMKLKFLVSDESSDDGILGSYNLVITKFPFEPSEASPAEMIKFFDELSYFDSVNVYGVDWWAGETVGEKETRLNKRAVDEFLSCSEHNKKFKLGFWEFDDNASSCTILGRDSDYPPRLIVEYK